MCWNLHRNSDADSCLTVKHFLLNHACLVGQRAGAFDRLIRICGQAKLHNLFYNHAQCPIGGARS